MASGTINGTPMLRATVNLPRYGVWVADVETTDTGTTLTGAVTLELAGLTLKGTVIGGGPHGGRCWYQIAGGAGGWAKQISAKAYRGEIGIKLATVATDAASEAGETLGDIPDVTLGPAYVRPAAPAARVLDLVAREAWYVDELGVTRFGARASARWTLKHTLLEQRKDQTRILFGAEDLTGLVPGAIVEGLEAVHVRHELTPDGLRTHVYSAISSKPGDPLVQRFKRMVEAFVFSRWYHGVYEYRVLSASGGFLDLTPVDTAVGLPDLANVRAWTGIPGGRGNPQAGSEVGVGFLNGDPTKPYVATFDGQGAAGWLPSTNGLEASTSSDVYAPLVRLGDSAAVPLAKGAVVSSLISALSTFATGLTTVNLSTQATNLVTALGTLGSPSTTKVKGT